MSQFFVSNREVKSSFHNENDFNQNAGDTTINLVGSIMERIQITHTVSIQVVTNSSISNEIELINNQLIRQSGSWIDDGFAIGDSFEMEVNPNLGTVATGFTVTAITDKILVYSGTIGTNEIFGENDGTVRELEVRGTSIPQGLVLKFGLIENNENTNYLSKTDGNEQGYYLAGISATDQQMQPLGAIRSWQSGGAFVRFLTTTGDNTYTFEVRNEFIIPAYYREGELADLKAGLQPSEFSGTNSLKYVVEYDFRTTLNDPNSSKKFVDDKVLGSVAWYDENANGFNNGFTVNQFDYVDTATTGQVTGFQKGVATTARVFINTNGNTVDTIGAYVSHLPNQSEYQNKTDDYPTIWSYDEALTDTLGTSFGGVYGVVQSVTAIDLSGVLFVQVNCLFNGALIDNGDPFLLGISVGSSGLTNKTSDRVNLLIDVGEFVVDTDIKNLIRLDKLEFYPHTKDLGTTGFTDYKGVIQDGVLCDYSFSSVVSSGAFIKQFDAKLVAWNTTDNSYFELENIPMPLTNQTITTQNGYTVQIISLVNDRGFQLEGTDQFDLQTISTGNGTTGVVQYSGQIGFKIDWQEWLALNGADSVFYDSNQPNNGLNEKASRYSLLNNYEIRFLIVLNVSNAVSNGVDTEYILSSPAFEIYDYDLDGNTTPEWTEVIETFNAGQVTNLNGTILKGQPTEIKATFTNITNPPTGTNGFHGVIRLEELNNPSKQKIHELSTLRNDYTNNLLAPLTGEVRTKISHSGNDIILEAQTNDSLLDPNVCYGVSARIFCQAGVISFGELTSTTNGIRSLTRNIGVILDGDGLAMTGQPISIVVKKDDGTIIETLTGVIGDNINTFSSDLSNTNASLTGNSFGVINSGGSILVDKKAWATSQNWYDFADPQLLTLEFVTSAASAATTFEVLKAWEGRAVRMDRNATTTTLEFAEETGATFAAATTANIGSGTFTDTELNSAIQTSSVDPTTAVTLTDPSTGNRKMKTEINLAWSDAAKLGTTTKGEVWMRLQGGGGSNIQQHYDGWMMLSSKIVNQLSDDRFQLIWNAQGKDDTPTADTAIAVDDVNLYLTDNTVTAITTESVLEDENGTPLSLTNYTSAVNSITDFITLSGYNYGDIIRLHMVLNDGWAGNDDPGMSIYTDFKLNGY